MSAAKTLYVYILSNPSKTIYIGVTNNLQRRKHEHLTGHEGFASKYDLGRLVYYEAHTNVVDAIAREKQLKRWSREKKVKLIESMNPEWFDLSEE